MAVDKITQPLPIPSGNARGSGGVAGADKVVPPFPIPPMAKTQRVEAPAGVERAASVSAPSASVEISKNEQPFDQKKLDEIKARIAAGEYKPNPEAIARSIARDLDI